MMPCTVHCGRAMAFDLVVIVVHLRHGCKSRERCGHLGRVWPHNPRRCIPCVHHRVGEAECTPHAVSGAWVACEPRVCVFPRDVDKVVGMEEGGVQRLPVRPLSG